MDNDQPGYRTEKPVETPAMVIRADANTAIGSGHVMRCLALAQAWQDQGGAVTFLSDLSAPHRERLHAEGIVVRPVEMELGSEADAAHLIQTAHELGAQHIVVDGYHFGAAYQQQLKDARLNVLFIDDNGHAEHYSADVVLNQNIYASEDLYPSREADTRLLLGTRYALLRREFQPWRGWRRAIPEVARRVLVTMGGSDPDNVTLKVLCALDLITREKLDVRVVIGGSNLHFAEIEQATLHSPHAVRLERNVTEMPALMAWADMAISAGGSTCWELAFMGLPSAIIVLADNQCGIAQGLADAGFVDNFGWFGSVTLGIATELSDRLASCDWRATSSQRGYSLVDSYGGERAIREFKEIVDAHSLSG